MREQLKGREIVTVDNKQYTSQEETSIGYIEQ